MEHTKAETVTKCFLIVGFGEADSTDTLHETNENIVTISTLIHQQYLSNKLGSYILNNDNFSTNYNFEPRSYSENTPMN